jgi:hypothetical protein
MRVRSIGLTAGSASCAFFAIAHTSAAAAAKLREFAARDYLEFPRSR